MKNADMPAMPQSNPETYPVPVCSQWAYGLTKREHFAAMAMQGLLSTALLDTPDAYAKVSVECADALLKALEG